MRRRVTRNVKKIVSVLSSVTMAMMLIMGSAKGIMAGVVMGTEEGTITSTAHSYEFLSNTDKEVPVKGQILDGTATETNGILYSEESTNNVTFDASQLKFRSGSVLYLPIQDDTTKITYTQTCSGTSDTRPTYVGNDDATYQVQMSQTAQSVTISDITDMIQIVGDQKYIAIYSHGDVKITKITLTEYNPVNRVVLSGTVENAAENDISSIIFKNMSTEELTEAVIASDNTYSVTLARVEGETTYTASISKTGYKLEDTEEANQFTLTGNAATAVDDFKVIESEVTYISGTLSGVPDEACKADLELKLEPEDPTLNTVDVAITKQSDGVYTFANVPITPDSTYTYELINANDYEVTETIQKATGTYEGLEVQATAKPLYTVTGSFVTSDESTAEVSSVTFTNMEEDGYAYTFEVSGDSYCAELRAGEYETSAVVVGYEVFDHVSVTDTAVMNDIYLIAPEDTSEVPYQEEIEVGTGKTFETIQSAVSYVARMVRTEDQRVTLKLTDELYREQVIVDTPNITITSDRETAPVVTWYYGIGYSYYSVAPSTESNKGFYSEKYAIDQYTKTTVDTHWGTTVQLNSTAYGFRSDNIVYENSFNRYQTEEEIQDGVGEGGDLNKDDRSQAGVDVQANKNKERACCMYIEADNCEYQKCSFFSSQDTIFTGDAEESIYFKNCVIEGTTDFICGNGNPVFDECTLSIYGYSDKAADGGFITASKEGGTQGYLFYNCRVVRTSYAGIDTSTKNVYFGRPWGAGTKVLFYNTEVESADLIAAAGYASMSNNTPADAFYSEYNTHTADGTALDVTGRAEGTIILTEEEAALISVTDYFGDWSPYFYLLSQTADYTAVNEAVAAAELLDADSYEDFSAVTASIAAVEYDLDLTRQDEVDAMASAITEAINALVQKTAGSSDAETDEGTEGKTEEETDEETGEDNTEDSEDANIEDSEDTNVEDSEDANVEDSEDANVEDSEDANAEDSQDDTTETVQTADALSTAWMILMMFFAGGAALFLSVLRKKTVK